MAALILSSLAGAHYHIGFPVFSRAVWGIWGSQFVVWNRVFLAFIWYGFQSWVGGDCVYRITEELSDTSLEIVSRSRESSIDREHNTPVEVSVRHSYSSKTDHTPATKIARRTNGTRRYGRPHWQSELLSVSLGQR